MSQAGKFITGGGGGGSLDTLTGNSGGPVSPTLGNINIVGAGVITVVGNPATHTLTISESGTTAADYTADSGTASPSANNINIFGDSLNINTSASGDTVNINLDNAITLGSLTPIAAFSSAATLTTGDLTLTLGNINLSSVNSGGSTGAILFDSKPALFWDATNRNWTVGPNASGSFIITGTDNVCLGYSAFANLLFGSFNTAGGNLSLSSMGNTAPDTSNNNTAYGYNSLGNLLSGSNNVALGYNAGSGYTTDEHSNISIGAVGSFGESNVTRLGTNGTQLECFIAGIDGVNIGSVATVVTESGDQLGTAVLTAGAGITITPGANTITISNAGSGFVWNDVTGGSATLAAQNGYVADSASLTTFTMPTNSSLGDTIKIMGKGTGGWIVGYGVGQTINFSSATTTVTTGSLASTNARDCIELVCTTPSGTAPIFTVASSIGNILVS